MSDNIKARADKAVVFTTVLIEYFISFLPELRCPIAHEAFHLLRGLQFVGYLIFLEVTLSKAKGKMVNIIFLCEAGLLYTAYHFL